MISAVVSQLGNLNKESRVGDIKQCLRDVAILTRSSLVDLGETPRSARSLGVPDAPTGATVRRSRDSCLDWEMRLLRNWASEPAGGYKERVIWILIGVVVAAVYPNSLITLTHIVQRSAMMLASLWG